MPPADGEWRLGWWRRAWYAAVGLVAPKRARLAKHFARYDEDPSYRAQWNTLFSQRGYKHARSTGQQTPFTSGFHPRSADAELLHDLHWLRNRSRELARDNSVASGVLRAWVEGVVGCGIQDRSAAGSGVEDEIDATWERLRDSLFPAERQPWAQMQRMMASRALEDGEYWVIRYWPEDGGPVQFELVEGDRVQTPLDGEQFMADPEGQIKEGIERDRFYLENWSLGLDLKILLMTFFAREHAY